MLLLLLLLLLWLLWLLLVVVVGGGGAAAAALVTLRSFVYCCGADVKAKCKRQSNALASWQAPFFDRSSSSRASDSANRAVPPSFLPFFLPRTSLPPENGKKIPKKNGKKFQKKIALQFHLVCTGG